MVKADTVPIVDRLDRIITLLEQILESEQAGL